MNIRAVFFDLDGTLVDSLGDLTDAVNHIRSTFSFSPLTMDAVRLKIGKGARYLVQQVLPGISEFEIYRALKLFLEFNKQHIADKSRLYPGIPDVLHELADRGIRMAVISNKNEDLSTLMVQALGIHDLFEYICGGDTYPERKPSPVPLLYIANTMGLAPFECVMAGDSINDILAGQQANIATIACSWGYGSPDELIWADALAHSPEELLSLIDADLGKRK